MLWPGLKTTLSSTTHWFSLRLHIPILYSSHLATNLYFYFALLQFVSKGAWNLLCLPDRKWCYNAIEWSNLLGISAGWQTQAHRTLHRWCLESFNLRYSLLSPQNCYYSPSTYSWSVGCFHEYLHGGWLGLSRQFLLSPGYPSETGVWNTLKCVGFQHPQTR